MGKRQKELISIARLFGRKDNVRRALTTLLISVAVFASFLLGLNSGATY